MRYRLIVGIGALCLLAGSGCSSDMGARVAPTSQVTVSMPATQLPGPHYAWVPMPAQLPAESDPRVLDPQFRTRLQAALDRALQAKGYTLAPSASQADFLVAYRVGVRDGEQVLLRDEGVGSQPTPQAAVECTSNGCSQMVVPGGDGAPVMDIRRARYTEGALQVEAIERSSIRVVWRALNRGTVSRKDDSATRLDAIARETLAQLPLASR
ncbi:DUF4136 domain-containing protein [Stenotrophomonas sp. HITSZ_GD]|uniref:DUF4136 domain-containing protein n=1 Tax=Stenotrophomonas sp. HITSZ_GD TaxID=3037248 RepID=UPI00240DF5D7|nr:DUF4136 domain-containing protein [Stenotrophomonas sp. HITSZ_GD]MDG2525286.1 DUF4136 domain-containing protein [Stenotrophomonas sp. HITSZ_GD]